MHKTMGTELSLYTAFRNSTPFHKDVHCQCSMSIANQLSSRLYMHIYIHICIYSIAKTTYR